MDIAPRPLGGCSHSLLNAFGGSHRVLVFIFDDSDLAYSSEDGAKWGQKEQSRSLISQARDLTNALCQYIRGPSAVALCVSV